VQPQDATSGIWSGDRFVPRAELDDRIARLAGALVDEGVAAGDAVAIVLRNEPAFVETTVATSRVGAIPVPVNWHWRGDEVEYLLRDCGAKVLLVHSDLLTELRDAVPDGVRVVVVPTPPEIVDAYRLSPGSTAPAAGDVVLDDWIAGRTPVTEQVALPGSSMIYTSGTTGRPKGVERRAADPSQIGRQMEMLQTVFGLRPGVRTVIPAPMYHSAPNAYGTASFALGALIVLMPRFDPVGFLELVERHAITHVQTVPTMFTRLLQLPEDVRRRYDVSSLEFVVHAAAPCPVDVKRAIIEWFGPVIWEYYGCTESGAVVLAGSDDWLAHPGTVGRPLDHAEVRVFDPDGRELPAGEPGDVYMRLHGSPDFTYRNDDAKRSSIGRGELITCGDIGYFDEDGFLYLSDRRNDMVISGGVNIYPAEIEACLMGLAGVRDVAVFGIPDQEYGEALAAHVELLPGASVSEDAVRNHVRSHLAGYMTPKVVVFDETLPREDSGKIFKRRLREPYWAGPERRI
jgi:long-chain acyl-CoA synthetase